MFARRLAVSLLAMLLAACSHAPPQIAQVFSQVNRVYDPLIGVWAPRFSVFVQGVSNDGNKVFDRLYLVNDTEGLYYSLQKGQWTGVERPGEFWVGANGLVLPEKPAGTWRALLVTRSGQQVTAEVTIPPTANDAPPPRTAPVALTDMGGKWRVRGWVDDYLVWAYDVNGGVLSRNKTVGPEFQVPANTARITLYSYDKARGEGLEAGPFVVKASEKTADR